MELEKDIPIIFYDGDCGFCNSSVQFILNKKRKPFYYCALQSDLAKEKLAAKKIEIHLDTIYVLKDSKIYDRSSAALIITRRLKGLWPLMMGFWLIPKFMRDWVYNGIAKRRHKIRAGYCMLPKEEDKPYFLS